MPQIPTSIHESFFLYFYASPPIYECLFNSVYLWPSFSKRTSKTSLRLHLATSVSLLQNIFHLVPIYIFPPSIGFYYMSNIFLSPLLYINWLQLILPSILTLLVSIDLRICQRQ